VGVVQSWHEHHRAFLGPSGPHDPCSAPATLQRGWFMVCFAGRVGHNGWRLYCQIVQVYASACAYTLWGQWGEHVLLVCFCSVAIIPCRTPAFCKSDFRSHPKKAIFRIDTAQNMQCGSDHLNIQHRYCNSCLQYFYLRNPGQKSSNLSQFSKMLIEHSFCPLSVCSGDQGQWKESGWRLRMKLWKILSNWLQEAGG